MKALFATALAWIATTSGAQALEIYSPSYYTAKIPYNCENYPQLPGTNGITAETITFLSLTNNSAYSLTVSIQIVDTTYGTYAARDIVIPAGNVLGNPFFIDCSWSYSMPVWSGYYVIQSVATAPGMNASSAYSQLAGTVEQDTYTGSADGPIDLQMGTPQSFSLTYVPGRLIR